MRSEDDRLSRSERRRRLWIVRSETAEVHVGEDAKVVPQCVPFVFRTSDAIVDGDLSVSREMATSEGMCSW